MKPKGKTIYVTWEQMQALFGCMELQLDQLLEDVGHTHWESVSDADDYKWSRNQLKQLNNINKKLNKAFNLKKENFWDWEAGLDD